MAEHPSGPAMPAVKCFLPDSDWRTASRSGPKKPCVPQPAIASAPSTNVGIALKTWSLLLQAISTRWCLLRKSKSGSATGRAMVLQSRRPTSAIRWHPPGPIRPTRSARSASSSSPICPVRSRTRSCAPGDRFRTPSPITKVCYATPWLRLSSIGDLNPARVRAAAISMRRYRRMMSAGRQT